jgi:hypothetical protein
VRNYVLALLAALTLSAANSGGKAEYIGGTLPDLRAKTGGRLILTDRDSLVFSCGRKTLSIPYAKIHTLEYGQRVNRRYLEAVVISPLFVLAKSRKHYLTLIYEDSQGDQQSMVFKVEKNDVRAVLSGLEARTGRRVEYQDEEARKSGKG